MPEDYDNDDLEKSFNNLSKKFEKLLGTVAALQWIIGTVGGTALALLLAVGATIIDTKSDTRINTGKILDLETQNSILSQKVDVATTKVEVMTNSQTRESEDFSNLRTNLATHQTAQDVINTQVTKDLEDLKIKLEYYIPPVKKLNSDDPLKSPLNDDEEIVSLYENSYRTK